MSKGPKKAASAPPIDDEEDEPAWDPSDCGDVSVPFLIEAAKREGLYVYDLETTGLNPRKHRIEGVAFYVPNTKAPEKPPVRAWFPFVDGTMDYAEGGELRSARSPLNLGKTMEQLRELWSIPDIIAVRHNGAFDDAFLYKSNGTETPIIVKNKIADSMLADYVADERRRKYGLKVRVWEVFNHRMTTYEEAAGKQGVFSFARKRPLGAYAMDDTMWTYRLFMWAMDSIRKQDPAPEGREMGNLERIFWNIEMKVQRILLEMELQGCLIDWQWLVEVEKRLEKDKLRILEEIQKLAGWAPNLRSPKQVSDFLYNSKEEGGLGLPTDQLDDTWNDELETYSTSDKLIAHFGKKEPIVKLLLQYRSHEVITRSFCQKLIGLAQEEERVYSRFRQTGTVIGRLSSADPINLMNQPREKNLIRRAFVSVLPGDNDPERQDLLFIDADYMQMELRMAAHLAQEPNMLEVYRNVGGCKNGKEGDGIPGGPCDRYLHFECLEDKGCKTGVPKDVNGVKVCCFCGSPKIKHQERCRHVDLHQRTAEDVKVKRNPLAKNLNFGLLYRMGAPKFVTYADLYDDDGKPRIEYAEELIELWHKAYPGIAEWHKRVIEQLKADKFIAYTGTKRRRRLEAEWRNPKTKYRAGTQAIQFRVSGYCQELIKLAMIRIFEERNKKIETCGPAEAALWKQFVFQIQVHDELVWTGPKRIWPQIREMVKRNMEGVASSLSVPFLADVRCGRNWDETH